MSPKVPTAQIKAFQAQIWAFYRASGRQNLPWRKTKVPYKILVSEVMLQQTQVGRVVEKYAEFLKVFPNIEALAGASLAEVLRVWQGMGYNRRARYLREAAQKIVREHKGRVPKTEQELRTLPGVGHYTANAILAFAHNEPQVLIETNIRRVFIHHFFPHQLGGLASKLVVSAELGNETPKLVGDKEILPLVEATVDTENPREWYCALMDYGAHLPKIAHKNPNRQSKHYTRQSMFKGSLRELRGKIIRSLTGKSATFIALKRVCDDDSRTKEALDALVKDRLIKYEKKKYQLA